MRAIPPANESVLVQGAGILGTAWVGMVAYYFGSSAGADRKTEIMANQVAGRRNITGSKPEDVSSKLSAWLPPVVRVESAGASPVGAPA